MAKARLPWHVFRPVLLAGAATLTWLALSTSAATADSSTDSLLGGVTSSVSSLSAPLTGPVGPASSAAILAPEPPSSGLLQSVVGGIPGTADQLIGGAPVINQVVPAGAVSGVSSPAVAVVNDTAAGLVETVSTPLVEAVPVLEPVLLPVAELVNDIVPLPVSIPDLESANFQPVAALPADLAVAEGTANQDSEFVGAAIGPAAGAVGPQQDSAGMPFAASQASTGADSPGTGTPVTADPRPAPAPAPPGPSSGSGGSISSAGSGGSAAWLTFLDFYLPPAGSVPLSGPSMHAPSPVSFDPGSSPD